MSETRNQPAIADQESSEVSQADDPIDGHSDDPAQPNLDGSDSPASPRDSADNVPAALVVTPAERGNLDMIKHIPVTMEIVLGSTSMSVEKLVKLGQGAIIPLDRSVGEPVDVVVNGRLVARGEVVVIDEKDSNFAIKITELVGNSREHPRNEGR